MNLSVIVAAFGFIGIFLFLTVSGTTRISGRVMALIDPSYATDNMPLVASVSEHAPTSWEAYFNDLNMIIFFAPVGLYYCLVHKVTHGKFFIAMYALCTVYFSAAMIRLMLIVAPATCILAAIGVSHLVTKAMKSIRLMFIGLPEGENRRKNRIPADVGLILVGIIFVLLKQYLIHSTRLANAAYSQPTFIQSDGRRSEGNLKIYDDFREAYDWLNQNTPKDSKVLAWWDYGYQLTGMSNRTVIVDNNTWNNTHIGIVGRALAANEDESHRICRKLDAKYMMVMFTGWDAVGGDDIDKFLWFVRIANSEQKDLDEHAYYNSTHDWPDNPTDTAKESMTWKMAYHRFGEMQRWSNRPAGFDNNREKEILGTHDIRFSKFREVYTSSHWMLRIYEVLDPENRDRDFDSVWSRKFSERRGEPEPEIESNVYWEPAL